MQKTDFFDCNCSIGRLPVPPCRYSENAAALLAEMDHCMIARAVVRHSLMRHSSPVLGNERIISECKENPRLIPAWTILPPQTGETPPPSEFYKEMCNNNIKVLWAFPNEHRYIPCADTLGTLGEIITDKKIPLFIKTDPVCISKLLSDFPKLILVAANLGPHSLERYTRPLLDRYENLYMENSSYMADGLIKEFCIRYGARRLLFGSGYPANCVGGAMTELIRADISPEDISMIACGNLERLINEVRD